jgi:hypothetical protein
MGLKDDVSSALASLGLQGSEGSEAVDAIADPGGAARALEGAVAVLRAAPELGAAAQGYGPTPAAPVWVRLSRGSREILVVPFRRGEHFSRRAAKVEIAQASEPCCDAPSCSLRRDHTTAWLHLEGGGLPSSRLLLAEQRALVPAPAPAAPAPGGVAAAIAAHVASFLGVPLTTPVDAEAAPTGEAEAELPAPLEALPLDALARHAIRSEGDRFVLRDLSTPGPRASALRNTVIGVALMLVAAFFWFELAIALRGDSRGAQVAFIAAGALFSLAGYAFLGVARFSSRYRAESSPLLALGRDRFIVLPWVSRTGAVDLRPEGRLGAAIPLGELRGVSALPRAGRHVVELDSDHGPIDALSTDHAPTARYWAAVITRLAAEVRHPSASASARQRARARGREEASGGVTGVAPSPARRERA